MVTDRAPRCPPTSTDVHVEEFVASARRVSAGEPREPEALARLLYDYFSDTDQMRAVRNGAPRLTMSNAAGIGGSVSRAYGGTPSRW